MSESNGVQQREAGASQRVIFNEDDKEYNHDLWSTNVLRDYMGWKNNRARKLRRQKLFPSTQSLKLSEDRSMTLQSLSTIRRYLPHLLVVISISLVMVGSAATVLSATSTPKALWSTNPITITFSHNTGAGSATDSFKCAPPYLKPIVLTTTVNNPVLVSLTTSPSSFPQCGPSYTTFTLTAHSIVPGTYSGTVTIRQTSQYGTAIPPSLIVKIVVT